MTGREDKKRNDLFFVCSLIEYVGRQTKNRRTVVVNALGQAKLQHIYDLAEVYHCENIDKLTYELVSGAGIETGDYDNVADCRYRVPTHWDIGKVFQRLIIDVCNETGAEPIPALIEVYNSWITDSIENYNSSMYYENPGYLFASYREGRPL